MNKKQLIQLGVPEDCIPEAIASVQVAAAQRKTSRLNPKKIIPLVVASPDVYRTDEVFGDLANALIEYEQAIQNIPQPCEYHSWGQDIDAGSFQQIENACRLPVAVSAALMPDAHVGYGLPIGGVLACEQAVVPYGVGVDIACRMKMTITDLPVDKLSQNELNQELESSLHKGTRFGVGAKWNTYQHHEVLDEDWTITAVTRENRDKACSQLGTSGSGNHFVEWGVLTLPDSDLGVEPGKYVALLSHSGSRGAGAAVCRRYTDIARKSVPARIQNDPQLRHLAWLDMNSEEGQSYWLAMNLMGRYASANHAVIHQNVLKLAGAVAIATVENHHNFAWKEVHDGREVFVHRKGATPASKGELGVIPGNMADSAFIVRGKGNAQSLRSASHGAGRKMSRSAAKQSFSWKSWRDHLREKNVKLLAGGLDEVPGAYKDIHEVMAAQKDLVEVVGEFFPKIVMMCGDGSPAED